MTRPFPTLHMDALAWTLLLALSVLWGGSFFFAKVALAEMPPLTLVLSRVAMAAATLHVVLALTGRRLPLDRRSLSGFALLGLFNNALPFGLIFWAQTHIASGLASILNALTPIATMLVAHALTSDERLSGGKIGGAVLGLAGVVLIVGPNALAGLTSDLLAQLACVAAAFSYGLAVVVARRMKGIEPIAIATGQLSASTLIMAPVAFLVETPLRLDPGAVTLASVLALAVASTAVAYILYFAVVKRAGATNAALVTLLVPATAVLLGSAFLAERLSPFAFAGMALIALGLLTIDGRLIRRRTWKGA